MTARHPVLPVLFALASVSVLVLCAQGNAAPEGANPGPSDLVIPTAASVTLPNPTPAVFDGRYLYFVSNEGVDLRDASACRYDTTGSIDDPSSWATFPLTNSAAMNLSAAVFDGRFAYFKGVSRRLPPADVVARFDTTRSFASTEAWETFRAGEHSDSSVSTAPFAGFLTDDYVCFPQANKNDSPGNEVLRFDTKGAFSDPASWDRHVVASIDEHRPGGAHGLRYIQLDPQRWRPLTEIAPLGVSTRETSPLTPVQWSLVGLSLVILTAMMSRARYRRDECQGFDENRMTSFRSCTSSRCSFRR